ncbi:MAG: hypothetical protein AAF216_08195 [Pseudomonadota bacterium]
MTLRLVSGFGLACMVAACGGAGQDATEIGADAGPAHVSDEPVDAPQVREIPENTVISATEDSLGDTLPVDVLRSGGVVDDGYFVRMKPDSELVDGIVGSYGMNGDSDTGTIEFTFEPDVLTIPIVLPIITGPDPSSLDVRVVCGEYTSDLDLEGNQNWAWREIPTASCSGDNPATVIVEDTGSEWGQWIAVGAPRLLLEES